MAATDVGMLDPDLEYPDDRLEVTRRLSDKILSAFNHAYAVGETKIAQKLRDVLAESEAMCPKSGDERGKYDPLGQADMWIAFVEARNRYKWVCENRRSEPVTAEEALEHMKAAYRCWSAS